MSELAARILQNHLDNGMDLAQAIEIPIIKAALNSQEVQSVIDGIEKPVEVKPKLRIKYSKSYRINLRVTENLYKKLIEFGPISQTVREILIEKLKSVKAGESNEK